MTGPNGSNRVILPRSFHKSGHVAADIDNKVVYKLPVRFQKYLDRAQIPTQI